MATTAEKIASGEREPTKAIKEAMEEVEGLAKQMHDGLDTALKSGELRNRVHSEVVMRRARDADQAGEDAKKADLELLGKLAGGEITERNAHKFSGITSEAADKDALAYHADWQANGCYAYQFQVMDDDSAIAIYVTKAGEKAKLKAFESLEATNSWHPVRGQG